MTLGGRSDLRLARDVVRVALPLMGGTVGNLILMLVDRLCLARYSHATLEASGPAVFTATTIILFFTTTAGISRSFVAQAFGRAGDGEAQREAAIGMVASVLLAVILLALAPAIAQIPKLADTSPQVTGLESTFLGWSAAFGAVMVLNAGLVSYFNSVGRAGVSLRVGLVGVIVDSLLTVGLVFGNFGLPRLGMLGSALGTLGATLVMLVCYLALLPTGFRVAARRALSTPPAALLQRLHHGLRRGSASGAAAALESLANTAFVWIAVLLGPAALAANNVVLSINYVAIIPIIGLGIAANVLCGNAIGRGGFDEITGVLRVTLAIAGVYVALIAVLQIFAARVLVSAFGVDHGTTLHAAVAASRVLWTYSFTFMFSMIGSSALESMGLTTLTLAARILIMWCLSVPVILLVAATHRGQPSYLVVMWIIGSVFEGLIGAVFMWRISRAVRRRENRLVAAEATEEPPGEIVNRSHAPAVSCFTGSLVTLGRRHGARFSEQQLLQRGDGYLLRDGVDERGQPELTFEVEQVGLRGVRALGCESTTVAVDYDRPLEQLRDLVRSARGAVVWVNSSHLAYADIYADNPPYLHSILVVEVEADLSRVHVHDALVVDANPYGCDGWLSAAPFRRAISDRVRSETHDHMGFFHVIERVRPSPPVAAADDLGRQADRFFGDRRFRQAIAGYRRSCRRAFDAEGDAARVAARRLFDHISVLYVVPNLLLMQHTLDEVHGADAARETLADLLGHWRALAVLALKFEATLSTTVRARIDDRFARIEQTTDELWSALAACGRVGVPVAKDSS